MMLVRILCSLFKICLLTKSRLRVFRKYGDVTITSEGVYILDLFCAPMSLEEGGIFIVPHLMRYEAQFLPEEQLLLRQARGPEDTFKPSAPWGKLNTMVCQQ